MKEKVLQDLSKRCNSLPRREREKMEIVRPKREIKRPRREQRKKA